MFKRFSPLFSGKRKFVTIPLLVIFGWPLLPLLFWGVVGYFIYKKVANKKLRTGSIALAAFIGIISFANMHTPNATTVASAKEEKTVQASTVQVEESKSTKSPTPTIKVEATTTTEPTKKPTIAQTNRPTAVPTKYIQPTAIPTQAPAVQQQASVVNTSGGDKNCSDFGSQGEAQAYFNARGGSASNNVDDLDGNDKDGIVCESL